MAGKNIILGLLLTDGYSDLRGAWRAPHVDPNNSADFGASVRYAQAAERGTFAPLLLPDFAAVQSGL